MIWNDTASNFHQTEMEPTIRALRVCVVAAYSGEATGGLASYLRCLTDHLSRECDVSIVARFTKTGTGASDFAAAETPRVLDHGRCQTHIIAPRSAWRPVLQRLVSLVTRPFLQPLALWLYRQAYQPSLRAAMPAAIDVVHYIGTGWEILGFATLAEARKRGAAFTILPAVHPHSWGDNPLDISLYNQADAVLVLSEAERTHLIRLGVEPFRLHCCGLAPASPPDGDGAAFRRRHGLGSRPLVLFIGRKDEGKGYHALREAIALVRESVPEVCLVAVGPDSQPPYPPVPDGALLDLGRADETEKADALAACDVFCLPSAHESFGIVYVEAWAYGKAIVGGPAPAVRELVSEGINGFCVAQTPGEIALILVRLLSEPAFARALGENGRCLQLAQYTWERVTLTHRSIFEAVVAKRRPAEV